MATLQILPSASPLVTKSSLISGTIGVDSSGIGAAFGGSLIEAFDVEELNVVFKSCCWDLKYVNKQLN